MDARTVSAMMLTMTTSVDTPIQLPIFMTDRCYLPCVIRKNKHNQEWAGSAYSGECLVELLSLGGFKSVDHEKGMHNHPLSVATKELNRVKSAIWAYVEHVSSEI